MGHTVESESDNAGASLVLCSTHPTSTQLGLQHDRNGSKPSDDAIHRQQPTAVPCIGQLADLNMVGLVSRESAIAEAEAGSDPDSAE